MIDFAIDSRIYLQNDIDLALQELDILFNTNNTELIGYVDFGTNFEQFLWQLSPSINELSKYINRKIQNETLYLKNMDLDIDIEIDNSDYTSNVYVIKISIKDEIHGEVTERIYKLK